MIRRSKPATVGWAFIVAAATLLTALTLPGGAHAWGDKGHIIVAHLASKLLMASARQQVTELLAGGESLEAVAVWADGLRGSYNAPGVRPETARWHFVDIPLSMEYEAVRDCPETANGTCVISALSMLQDVLAKKRAGYYADSRQEALKFIVHLVGDIHQPLHCVDDHDFGGNLKTVVWIDGDVWKLHAVWDEAILTESMKRRNVSDPIMYAEHLFTGLTDQERQEAKPTPSPAPTVIRRSTIEGWAKAAHAIAKGAYADIGPPDQDNRYRPGASYYDRHKTEVDNQLARAGIRLARMLNENLR